MRRRRFVSIPSFSCQLVARQRSVKERKREREMSGVSTAAYVARRAAQKEQVRILYRRALKDTLNWAVHRHLFYQDVRTALLSPIPIFQYPISFIRFIQFAIFIFRPMLCARGSRPTRTWFVRSIPFNLISPFPVRICLRFDFSFWGFNSCLDTLFDIG